MTAFSWQEFAWMAVAALATGCAPASTPGVDVASVQLKQVCDKRCACETCRREDASLCVADANHTPALARRSHCDAALDAWARCEASSAVCLGGKFLDESCGKERANLDACVGR